MSQLKKILLLLAAMFMAVSLAHAAVRSITDLDTFTERGNSAVSMSAGGSGVSADSSEGDDGHTSSYSGVECGDKNADTPEGCNKLLNISNAVATPCDGGKYRCEQPENPIPLAAYPECDANAVDNSSACIAPAQAEQCTTEAGAIKYNCRCPSEYYSTCPPNQFAYSGATCTDTKDGEKKQCYPSCPGNGHTLVLDINNCPYALNKEFATQCLKTDGRDLFYDCEPDCRVFDNSYPQYRQKEADPYATIEIQASQCRKDDNGILVGGCFRGDEYYAVCGCSDDYVEECGEAPTCLGGQRPVGTPVCTAENDVNGKSCQKPLNKCTYQNCRDTDRTTFDVNSWANILLPSPALNPENKTITLLYEGGTTGRQCKNDYGAKMIDKCILPLDGSFVSATGEKYNDIYTKEITVERCGCSDDFQHSGQEISESGLVPIVYDNTKNSGSSTVEIELKDDVLTLFETTFCLWDALQQRKEGTITTTKVVQGTTGNVSIKTLVPSSYDNTKILYRYNGEQECTTEEKNILKQQYPTYDENKLVKDWGTNNRSSSVASANLEEHTCARQLPAVEKIVFGSNTREQDILGLPLYEKVSYFACPKDYKESCGEGLIPGGKRCTKDDVIYYEACLPKCKGVENATDAQGRMYTDLTSLDKCSNIEQKKIGTWEEASLSNRLDFIKNNQANLCFSIPEDKAPKWQCTCNGYKTKEECGAGKMGTGEACTFDSTDTETITKYPNCSMPCPTEAYNNWVEKQATDCQYNGNQAYAEECYQPGTDGAAGQTMFLCSCPNYVRSLLEKCGGSLKDGQTVCDDACRECHMEKLIGLGAPCQFNSKDENGSKQSYLYQYSGFGEKCSWLQKQAGGAELKIVDSEEGCGSFGGGTASAYACYDNNGKQKKVCKCPDSYKTIDKFCEETVAAGEKDVNGQLYTLESCKSAYVGVGSPCTLDNENNANVKKYYRFGITCPNDAERVKKSEAECAVGGEYKPVSTVCYKDDNDGAPSFVCGCPENFDSRCYTDDTKTILDPTKIRGGVACPYSSETLYDKCLPQCENTETTPVVLNPDDCPLIDGVQADSGEMCFNKYGDENALYACRCPKSQGYQTIEEYCSSQKDENGNSGIFYQGRFFTSTECKSRFIGVGAACTYDGNGSVKYKTFSIVCPTDRPLYYSADECTSTSMPGALDYYCYEAANLMQQRVVCKCPETWVDINGNKKVNGTDTRVCSDTEEAAGQICSFDGNRNLKYEKCYTRCDKMNTNGKGVSYLEEEDAYDIDCKNLLGDGATFGVDGVGGQCSQHHTLAYPCYCGSTYKELCLNTENKMPAPGALACTINGQTYYEECANNSCSEESASVAIIEDTNVALTPETLCRNAGFGPGVSGKRCGEKKIECACNAREYSETCDYPYEKPDKNEYSWCKYGINGGLMKDGVEHFKLGECTVKPALAQCGKYILNDNGSQNTSVVISVASTESQCTAKLGTGAKAQLCEYAENPNKRAYNCYYNPAEFVWTEDNCPVRHILGKNYIIKNGTRYYDACDCHPAYKNHKYNCAGMLSGGTCSQKLSADIISADSTLRRAASDKLIGLGDELSFYPYCQCTSDYNQECDGERNVGVGEPCNGKYKACECKPDPLPENWADNYYGCPGGKKPTGVTKSNGCGGKYYQCEVSQCTWQHTEKCLPPLVGIDPCQDNEGNIGGYKSCKCPDGYALCPDGTVGTGEPCMLKGQYYYKEGSCVTKESCVHGESQLCQGSLQIGVNPCTRNGLTYFEYCVCASGYDKACNGDNEVGVGAACTLNGTKYYTECATPATTCTWEHQESCDTNQSSYDPCVSADNKIMYKCKCPSNWKSCDTEGPSTSAESCTDGQGTVYSACAVSNECTSYQNLTYKACNQYQVGTGGSCIVTDGDNVITKYAECDETSACRLNGYQFSCQGYDEAGLGDSCVDEMGNRLYKSCGCPKEWVECPSKNNKKGRSCTPLSENGILGKTVYESCTCDRSIYKATCEKTSENQGVIPAKSRACTEVIYGEGEQPTYYESCDCETAYKYTCTANGQIKDDNNYCQKTPNGEKLYTHCECESDYANQCLYDPANPGLGKPKDSNKACTPLNSDTGDNTTKYTQCECGQYYTEICTNNGQLNGENADPAYQCFDGVTTRYRQCDCAPQFAYSCLKKGNNKGILPPNVSGSKTCIQIKYDEGVKKTTTMYASCTCDSNYKYSCDAGVADGTDVTRYTKANYVWDADYCEIPRADDSGATKMIRRFKECKCSEAYNKTCEGDYLTALNPDDVCVEISAQGTPIKKYKECTCEAKMPDAGSGKDWYQTGISISSAGDQHWIEWDGYMTGEHWKKLGTENQNRLKWVLSQECNSYKNATLKWDGCGKLYYQCIVDTTAYPYYDDDEESNSDYKTNCHANDKNSTWEVQGTPSQGTNGSLGSVIMYSSCDCNPKYDNSQECSEIGDRTGSTAERPVCYLNGHDGNQGGYTNWNHSCNMISRNANQWNTTSNNTKQIPALVHEENNASCVKADGKRYYIGECDCNGKLFKDTGQNNNADHCYSGSYNKAYIEFGAHCITRAGKYMCMENYISHRR